MIHDRTYRPFPHAPALRLRDADNSMRPHTYGVRVCSCAAIATEPCRPTACAGEYPCCTFTHPATAHYSLLTANSTYTFSAKERDSETSLSYFGARYYSSDLSIWLSVDPMSDKYAYQSGYVYCGNNPIKIIDPNGMWEWDASGNLVAQSKDNSYTLAAFLGTSPQNAMTILSRSGVTADNNGILNLKSGQVLSKHTLYIDHGSGDFPTVKDNMEAIAHYYSGNGKPASVGLLAALAILKSDKFKSKHNKITTMGTASPEGYFSVDLTSTAQFFHIGETGVDYSITGNGKTSAVTYTLFTNTDKNSPNKTDGFWDPNFIIETTLGKVFNRFSSDEKGNKLELGGTPYPYAVRKITFFYKPVEE